MRPIRKAVLFMRPIFRTMVVALLAALALSAAVASAAQAETAPYFKVGGARLAAGESKEVTGGHVISLYFGSGAQAMKCSVAFDPGAKISGSAEQEHGRIEIVLELSSCTEGNQHCQIEGIVKSKPLRAELVSAAKGGGDLEAWLRPTTGTEFMRLKFKEGCGYGKEQIVEGSVVAEIYSGGNPVEGGKEPAEAKTVELVFPHEAIGEVWLVKEGTGKLQHNTYLSAGIAEIKVVGEVSLALAGGANWGVFD